MPVADVGVGWGSLSGAVVIWEAEHAMVEELNGGLYVFCSSFTSNRCFLSFDICGISTGSNFGVPNFPCLG